MVYIHYRVGHTLLPEAGQLVPVIVQDSFYVGPRRGGGRRAGHLLLEQVTPGVCARVSDEVTGRGGDIGAEAGGGAQGTLEAGAGAQRRAVRAQEAVSVGGLAPRPLAQPQGIETMASSSGCSFMFATDIR